MYKEPKPGANVTQVVVDSSFCSRNIYVRSAAVPPPKECPTICLNQIDMFMFNVTSEEP